MALEIVVGRNSEVLENFSYNKDDSILVVSSVSGSARLQLDLPFNLGKVPDQIFDFNNPMSEILIFRNNHFAEKDCIEVKFNDGTGNKSIGFLFSLSGLLESDNIIDKKIAPYAARSLVMLMTGKTDLPSHKPEYRHEQDYTLWDFFSEDLVICAISLTQIANYSPEFKLSLIVNLSQYGFYLLSDIENSKFIPPKNSLHKIAFEDLVNQGSKINLKMLSPKIALEPYFKTYYTSLVLSNDNYISKFLIIYQCFEILMDIILRFELEDKITPLKIASKTAYQMKEMVMEMSTESYRMDALFKHYAECNYESDYHVSADIVAFFEAHRENYTMRQNQNYGSIFYELRNQLIHNLKIIYKGSDTIINQRKEELSDIINKMEFLINEILLGLKL